MELNTFQLISFELVIAGIGIYLGLKCIPLHKDNMNYFRNSVIILDFFLLINIPIRLTELRIARIYSPVLYLLYDASILLMTGMMLSWFIFLLKQIESVLVKTKLRIYILSIPAACVLPLCIINRWTGWLYYIGSDGWYHRGSVFILQSLIAYLYFIAVVLTNTVHFFISGNKPVVKKCFMSTIPAFISGFFQFAFGGSYLLAGSTICALIMYIEICLDRQKAYEINEQLSAIHSQLANSNKTIANNMRTILALSDIYHVIYDVDIQNDTFTEIKAPEYVSKICKQFTKASEGLRALPEIMYGNDSLKVMKELYNPDTLVSRFKNHKSYSADAIGKISKIWLRNSFVVSETDDKGNPLHIIVTLQDVNLEKESQKKLEEAAFYEKSAKEMEELFTQTAEALVSAIDAKDEYTHGHSVRVAEYSKKMAEMSGLSEKDCKEVYYAGLLHDVGKIGIPDEIIRKTSKLSDEEFAQIKKHPATGFEILQSISKLPYLSIGAHYHHERYDGHGYPDGLKGTDIPEMARIIAVADAYDAMTSKRSYRAPIPQQKVREEIVKGLGTQFDPEFGKLMIHLIDQDIEYAMQEPATDTGKKENPDLLCKENEKKFSEGILIDAHKVTVKAHFTGNAVSGSYPYIVLFDALDARIHEDERDKINLFFTEYCQLFFNGKSTASNIRKIQTNQKELSSAEQPQEYNITITAVKIKDHILLKMDDGKTAVENTIALPDSTRYAYISLTGENCTLSRISTEREEGLFPAEKIQRIAEEISYIDQPEGDIPNLQIDGWKTAVSKGLDVKQNLNINFHMKSLPIARLVWHCPFIVIFTSANGELNGPDYREFSLVRLDGECFKNDNEAEIKSFVEKSEDFKDWNSWKEDNKKGRDISVAISRSKETLTLQTECGGIKIRNTITLPKDVEKVFAALTGDQCVMENIRIS